MINEKSVLAIIPARGGSKGIKGKNIFSIEGKPLIAYTIEAACASEYIDTVIVSTDNLPACHLPRWAYASRDYSFPDVLLRTQLPFLRPAELASDYAKTIDAVLHAVYTLKEMGKEYDYLVLLQPTQPLRSAEDIDHAIILCDKKMRGVVSIVKDHPVLMRYMNAQGEMCKLLELNSTVRRQDMPDYYRVNGCVYVNPMSEVTGELSFNDNPIPYIMPVERSVDIDGYEDIALVEYYLRNL